ncbi:hypothetical protein NMY22_g17126 [Coprinellus aureogranulatus]|nr:hypothetical protein NMY22_g17126 [Coprinellus aureogranulatus]
MKRYPKNWKNERSEGQRKERDGRDVELAPLKRQLEELAPTSTTRISAGTPDYHLHLNSSHGSSVDVPGTSFRCAPWREDGGYDGGRGNTPRDRWHQASSVPAMFQPSEGGYTRPLSTQWQPRSRPFRGRKRDIVSVSQRDSTIASASSPLARQISPHFQSGSRQPEYSAPHTFGQSVISRCSSTHQNSPSSSVTRPRTVFCPTLHDDSLHLSPPAKRLRSRPPERLPEVAPAYPAPEDRPTYLRDPSLQGSYLFPKLRNSDSDVWEEDDYEQLSDSEDDKKFGKQRKDPNSKSGHYEQRRLKALEVPRGAAPPLDEPMRVLVAIDMIKSGEREDFAGPVTIAWERIRRQLDAGVKELSKADRDIWAYWKPQMRPGWVKDAELRAGTYHKPLPDEPLWVHATAFWLFGSAAQHERPWAVCLKLLACPGLYAEILKTHSIKLPPGYHLFPELTGFIGNAKWGVVDAARWFASNGLRPETADAMVHFAQEHTRSRLIRGEIHDLAVDDAVWVSRWLVHRRHVPLPADEENWFIPHWADEATPNRPPNRISSKPRTQVHLLEGVKTKDEIDVLLGSFDLKDYV